MIAGKAQTFIKKRIERIGTPLKEWNISINYGIKTGCNEAFIIAGKKKVFLHQLPIPKIPRLKQQSFEVRVDCVLFARANGLESEADQVEDVLDGLVYDLYFEEEIREANCRIPDRVAEVVKPFKEDDTDAFKTEYIQNCMHFFEKTISFFTD